MMRGARWASLCVQDVVLRVGVVRDVHKVPHLARAAAVDLLAATRFEQTTPSYHHNALEATHLGPQRIWRHCSSHATTDTHELSANILRSTRRNNLELS